jgi:hypothetical protein
VLARAARRLFIAAPMPDLVEPPGLAAGGSSARLPLRVVS